MKVNLPILLTGALVLLMPIVPAAGQSSVKVVVNGLPVTSYDIAQRLKLFAISGQKGGTKEATDDLVDEALQLSEAARLGVQVTDAQVDAAFASIAQQLKLSPAQFSEGLSQRGLNAQTLKNRLKAQIAWRSVVEARVSRSAAVKAKDVTSALLAKGDADALVVKEYSLQQIIFVVPKGSSSDYAAQRRREAEAFRQRFSGCDKSIDLAKGLKDVAVKDLGRRTSTELLGPRGEDVKATAVGKAGRPNQSDMGVELVAVCSVKEVKGDSAARNEIQTKLAGEQSEQVSKDYLKELRGKAVIVNH